MPTPVTGVINIDTGTPFVDRAMEARAAFARD